MIFVGVLAGLLISAIGMAIEGELLMAGVAFFFAVFFIAAVTLIRRDRNIDASCSAVRSRHRNTAPGTGD